LDRDVPTFDIKVRVTKQPSVMPSACTRLKSWQRERERERERERKRGGKVRLISREIIFEEFQPI